MSIEEAKELLRQNGFYVDKLWHVEDVKSKSDVNDDDAYRILDDALTNDWIMEQINVTIGELVEQ